MAFDDFLAFKIRKFQQPGIDLHNDIHLVDKKNPFFHPGYDGVKLIDFELKSLLYFVCCGRLM